MDTRCISLIFATVLTLTACMTVRVVTVKGPDLSSVRPGATRGEIEAILGGSIRQWTLPGDVTYRVYTYSGGAFKRDIAMAVGMDVITLGVISITELEAQRQTFPRRRQVQIAVSFNENDVVIGTFSDFHEFDDLPLDGRNDSRPNK